MQIEAGKRYKTRGGSISEPATVNVGSGDYAFRAMVDGGDHAYTVNGNYWKNGQTSTSDLITEHVEALTPDEISAVRRLLMKGASGSGMTAKEMVAPRFTNINVIIEPVTPHVPKLAPRKAYLRDVLKGDLANLKYAFSWAATPQGFGYWDSRKTGTVLHNDDFDYVASLLAHPEAK